MGYNKEALNLMHMAFVNAYANPKSKTYSNATKSYVAAGYKPGKSNAQCACQLLNSPKIQKQIAKYAADTPETTLVKQEISKDYALSCLQTTYEKAIIKKDVPAQVACVRLMMQYNGLLIDRMVVHQEDAIDLDENYQRQYKQIASIIIHNSELGDEGEAKRLTDSADQVAQDVVSASEPAITEAEFEDVSTEGNSGCEITGP
jgi:hypothetical protein